MNLSARLATTAGVARSLLTYYGQPWRRWALKRFYQELIQPGDLVFDVGAHVGNRSKTLMTLGAEVVAIEPQPAFADLIERHFLRDLKGFERVTVGACEGEVTLTISSRHPTVSSTSTAFLESVRDDASFRQVTWDSELTVPMTTLDALIARYGRPVFCKIDCEGAEAAILCGLSAPIQLVAFEYLRAMPLVTVAAIERLMTLGDYRFNRVLGEQHRFVDQTWLTADAMLDVLASLPAEDQHGDIYARLVSDSTSDNKPGTAAPNKDSSP